MMELSECLYRPGLWLHLKPLKPLKDRTIHQTRVIFKAESVMGDGGGKKKEQKSTFITLTLTKLSVPLHAFLFPMYD